MRLLHVIHDFLPRHGVGAEIYASNLCRELSRRHQVRVLCAEYDPTRPHGALVRRRHAGLAVDELINNWDVRSFEETYRSPLIDERFRGLLDELRPDLLHIHNLLTLSLDLPAIARERGVPSVATLHDHTLVCPSGGQRVHVAEEHVCTTIDPERCARCFVQSPLHQLMSVGPLVRRLGSLTPLFSRFGRRALPVLAPARAAFERVTRSLRHQRDGAVGPGDIRRRLEHAATLFETVELFVSPSRALAEAFVELGLPRERLEVSDYGFPPLNGRRGPRGERLRIGFVGTLVWHKGLHLLLEAARALPRERFELLVFGSLATFPDHVATLRRMARDLPVRFMGAFDAGEAARVYGQIDALVVPSLWPENSPLVIHEASMAGVPVVGARMGGIPELVQHEVSGLTYEARSAAALALALARLIDEPGLLERLASAAPPVKPIEDDAADWEARYARVLSAREPGGAR